MRSHPRAGRPTVATAPTELDDPRLRERALASCVVAAPADGPVSESAQSLLARASRRRGLDSRLTC